MDVLEFAFESDELKKIQQEVRNLGIGGSPILVVGDVGTGKTAWAHAACRLVGVAHIVESHEAPKSLKAWRDISLSWDKNPVVLEDIDKWNDVTQSAFAQFMKEQKRQFKRIVATSSTRILGKVREGQFRSDVYYTLSVRKVDLPKVQDCLADFDRIVEFWIEVTSLMNGVAKPSISRDALFKMKMHKWSGNFTELVNVLERALSFGAVEIQEAHVKFDDWNHDYSDLEAGLTLAEVEKKLILQTLNLTAQNKSQAARMLGISIRTLRNKLNEYRQEESHELI
jgi:two-component system response regulator FlrC